MDFDSTALDCFKMWRSPDATVFETILYGIVLFMGKRLEIGCWAVGQQPGSAQLLFTLYMPMLTSPSLKHRCL
jgi:hypothetical protein